MISTRATLGSARVSRAGDGVAPSRTSLWIEITRKDRFSEDAETNTRDACATQSAACPRPL